MKYLVIAAVLAVVVSAAPERERRSLGWGHPGSVVLGGLLAPPVAVLGPHAASTAVLGPHASPALVVGAHEGATLVAGPSGVISTHGLLGHGVW